MKLAKRRKSLAIASLLFAPLSSFAQSAQKCVGIVRENEITSESKQVTMPEFIYLTERYNTDSVRGFRKLIAAVTENEVTRDRLEQVIIAIRKHDDKFAKLFEQQLRPLLEPSVEMEIPTDIMDYQQTNLFDSFYERVRLCELSATDPQLTGFAHLERTLQKVKLAEFGEAVHVEVAVELALQKTFQYLFLEKSDLLLRQLTVAIAHGNVSKEVLSKLPELNEKRR